MASKADSGILARFGYRKVLVANTILWADDHAVLDGRRRHTAWLIVVQAITLGFSPLCSTPA